MEPTDKDHLNFLKIFFNSLMRGLRFETIGRKSFNSAKAHSLDAHKIKVWPGFDARLIMKESGVLLNIDVCFKVVRQDTVLAYMNELRTRIEQKGGDWKEELQEALKGTTVVTRYEIYQINLSLGTIRRPTRLKELILLRVLIQPLTSKELK
jgi:hypothetical protein